MSDRWGENEWDDEAPRPSTLWVRLMVVYLLGAVAFSGIVGAAWEYSNWQDSKVPSGFLQDYSPSAYLLAMIFFLVIGLLAAGASWLIWARRDRSRDSERGTFNPERPADIPPAR